MADAADIASEIEEMARTEAIAATQRVRSSCTSRTYCIDCDEVIPHRRRALGGIVRCIGCQEFVELTRGRP